MRDAHLQNPAYASVKGKVIVITGAGSGIGAATAVELQRRGAILVLADCDADALETANAQLDRRALTVIADVSQPSDCEEMVTCALAQHGRIDIVWANAGIASFGPLALTDPLAWRRCIEVNVFGVFNTVRAALPEIVRTRGFVVVSASVSSFAHPPGISAYAASKAAVEAMSNAWRIELSAHGVGVGVIHASWIKTPLVTEGNMHPGFRRLRATMPRALNREVDAVKAAQMIANGIERRARQIWVPGWVKALHWLRAFLHTPLGERELVRAAPEIESLFLEGLQTSTVKASSFPPRELARAILRGDASG